MPSLRDSLVAASRIARYRGQILTKRLRATFSSGPGVADLPATPAVTVFITNINNRFPLELTLRTLTANTEYPNYTIWVADNGSTDGSLDMVRELTAQGLPIRLIEHGEARPQHEWYDLMAETVETPLWVGMHEDMMFIDGDWLVELVLEMERRPGLLLLGGEYFPPRSGIREPVSNELVNLKESLSTWLFCARAELREYVPTSFSFYKHWSEDADRTILYDQGGKLIRDIRETDFEFDYMPTTYAQKYQHIANVSWAFKHNLDDAQRAYKLHQLADARRRVESMRRQSRPRAAPTRSRRREAGAHVLHRN